MLIEFKGAIHGKPVYINPVHVASVVYYEPGVVAVWLNGIQYPTLVSGEVERIGPKLSIL